MRITRFRASGYRSLRDFEIDGLGAVNVFYGPNGSGKSNILAALQTLFRVMRLVGSHNGAIGGDKHHFPWLDADDFSIGAGADADVKLAATLADVFPEALVTINVGINRLNANITVSSHVEFDPIGEGAADEAWAAVRANFEERGVALIDAIRRADDVAGQLFAIKNHPDRAVRASLDRLRALLAGPPLHRPPFDVVQFPDTKKLQLREQIERDGAIHDIPVDLAGLGVAQLYSILSQIKLSKARAVAIEEPEAHLHGPTSGRHLRELLLRLVSEGDIDQLFVATHSNLFDLDPTGYFDVELVDGWTRATRKPLADLHEKHLYEPGPMKHVLRAMLDTQMERDRVMFRTREGEPVTVAKLIEHLDRDDDIAFEYVRGLYGTAMELYGLRARKEGGG